tara:strand:- start:426 stop:779 length:354 start_codon:yes stop_codon:yes gene_type:complete
VSRILPPITLDISQWAENMRRYLGLALDQLGFKDASASASQDGVLLWDAVGGYPVISKSGAFKEVVLKNTAPVSSVGVAGDKAGLISWDASYIYVCTGAYDASSHIWSRAALTGGSW